MVTAIVHHPWKTKFRGKLTLYSFFPTAGMFVKQVALMFLPFGVAVIGTMAVYEFQKVAGKASP